MATVTQFNFTDFVKSLLWLAFWILMIFTLIILPLVFIILFYVPAPQIKGIEITPYLLLSMIVNPDIGMPLIKATMETSFFKVAVFPGFTFAALFATVVIFFERKFLAKMQLRVGPYHAGREVVWWARNFGGFFQMLADLLKLLGKEIIIPAGADKPIFWAAPVVLTVVSAGLLSVIPAAPGWVIADIDVGLLVIFAILGFFPLTALLASWASNSKYPFIGGLRALHQMIAYEIPLILSALGVVILSGSLNLSEIVVAQQPYWYILFLPVGAFVFFITALAELERIPFDLPEAESEIVAGWLTEYSGMAYGLIQLASYIKLYALAAVFVTIFLGGWMGPPVAEDLIIRNHLLLTAEEGNGIFWFIVKTFGVSVLMLLPRGINPRIRIDILLRTGWAKLIAVAFINIFIALGLLYAGVIHPVGVTGI